MKTRAAGLRNARANANGPQVAKPGAKRQPLAEIRPSARPAAREQRSVCQKLQRLPPAADAAASAVSQYERVGDVDKQTEDSKNCLLVACYVKEIFSHLRSLEGAQPVRQGFLHRPAALEITPAMHRILFNWLVQVHNRFALVPETLYLTFHIVDYYMSVKGHRIVKENFQLLGVAAMFLAAKYEEIYPPEISDFVYLTDNTYTGACIRKMERSVLACVQFFVGYPLEIQFLRRYTKVAGASADVHDMAKYLTELSRTDYELAHLPPSGLAAAAFCLARELLGDAGDGGGSDTEAGGWTPALEVFSGYARPALLPAIRAVAVAALRAQTEQRFTAVRSKYASKAFSCISGHPLLADPGSAVLAAYASDG